jgi:hypothetical protein
MSPAVIPITAAETHAQSTTFGGGGFGVGGGGGVPAGGGGGGGGFSPSRYVPSEMVYSSGLPVGDQPAA